MQIRILNMLLRNFKGIRNLEINFDDITSITGDNATGKTTVFDAFTWLLFGKNSSDAKEFNIKTLDENNNPIHKLEHEVTATLDVDGRHVTLRRLFKEKWVKKKGSEAAEFTGHETEYFVDDVPLTQKEYQARIDFMLKEEIAKLITNPLYFNQMKWQDRRRVLEAIAGAITDEEIAESNAAFRKLISLLGNDSLIDFKKKIAAKKKLIKDNLEGIPTRIDEANRNMPEQQDFAGIEKQIALKQGEVAEVDLAIGDKTKIHEKQYGIIQEKQKELNGLRTSLINAENENKKSKSVALAEKDSQIRTIESKLRSDRSESESINNEILKNDSRIINLRNENTNLRGQWAQENAKTLEIDEHKFSCPTCKQLLPEDQRLNMQETLTTNFNTNKANRLKEIGDSGERNKVVIEELTAKNEELKASKATVDQSIQDNLATLSNLKSERIAIDNEPIKDSEEVLSLRNQISSFEIPASPVIDNTELNERKRMINLEIDFLKEKLASREVISKMKSRIKDLETTEKELSQELADLEKTEFSIDAFSRAKIEAIESRINGKFSMVRFKMFEQQINGGEVESCECMVNGVPYSDVNTAGKINAGIDIINALTQHYAVNAPVWIDNRESIIRILPCSSQIINLIAIKDAKLTVTTEQSSELIAA